MRYYIIDGNRQRNNDTRTEYDRWQDVINEVVSIFSDYADALERADGKSMRKRKTDSIIAEDVRFEINEWNARNIWTSNLPYKVTIGNQYVEVGEG